MSKARALGIRIPIIPGLMPVTNYSQVQRFTAQCGATLPSDFTKELETVQTDTEAVTRLGVQHAAQQGEELLRKGAPGIHFYTLNKSRAAREILEGLETLRAPTRPRLSPIFNKGHHGHHS